MKVKVLTCLIAFIILEGCGPTIQPASIVPATIRSGIALCRYDHFHLASMDIAVAVIPLPEVGIVQF